MTILSLPGQSRSGGGGMATTPTPDEPDPAPFQLRAPCRCGNSTGIITPKGGQDVANCGACGAYQYCAPRAETGRERRSLARTSLTPGKRARVLRAHANSCVGCGAHPPDVELHIGHLVPRADAIELGLPEHLADHDFNLAPMCAECNAGLGRSPVAIGLMYRLLVLHLQASDVEF